MRIRHVKSETPESGFSRVSEAALPLPQAGLSVGPRAASGALASFPGRPCTSKVSGGLQAEAGTGATSFCAEHPTEANFSSFLHTEDSFP